MTEDNRERELRAINTSLSRWRGCLLAIGAMFLIVVAAIGGVMLYCIRAGDFSTLSLCLLCNVVHLYAYNYAKKQIEENIANMLERLKSVSLKDNEPTNETKE